MAKVFRWRYAWRRAGRQTRFGERTVVEQIEVHEDGSTEVVGSRSGAPVRIRRGSTVPTRLSYSRS